LNSNKNNINKINLYKTYREQKHSYVISKEKDPIQKGREKNKEKEHINKRCITYSNFTNSFLTTTKNNIPRRPVSAIKKFKFRTPKDELENRKVDKFIFNKSYFKQLSYFENLINKELFFQRIFLEQREANAKMFLRGYQHEIESMGIIPREEVYNTFLILNDKVTSKNRNYEKEMKLEIEFKNKPRVFGNMFKSVSQKMKEGKKIRSAVGKVLDKYLLAQKKQKAKRNIKFNKKEINRKNEVYIMNNPGNDHTYQSTSQIYKSGAFGMFNMYSPSNAKLNYGNNRIFLIFAHYNWFGSNGGHTGDSVITFNDALNSYDFGNSWGSSHSLEQSVTQDSNFFWSASLGDAYPMGILIQWTSKTDV